MKRILTIVCLCLTVSIMSAKGFSAIDSKDVLKQKLELVKAQDLAVIDGVAVASTEIKTNFKVEKQSLNTASVMYVKESMRKFNTYKSELLLQNRHLRIQLYNENVDTLTKQKNNFLNELPLPESWLREQTEKPYKMLG